MNNLSDVKQSAVRPIETRYDGHHFRSRLEARYAVFFNAMGIRWEYEAEGYETPAGRYLPDFVLHLRRPTLFEVKAETKLYEQPEQRWLHVARATGMRLVVAYGLPRHGQLNPRYQPGDGHYRVVQPDHTTDIQYAFGQCPVNGVVGIDFLGRIGRECAHPECDLLEATDTRFLEGGYDLARSFRFESSD